MNLKNFVKLYKNTLYINNEKILEFKWSSFKKFASKALLILISVMVILGLVLGTVMMTLPPTSTEIDFSNLFGG